MIGKVLVTLVVSVSLLRKIQQFSFVMFVIMVGDDMIFILWYALNFMHSNISFNTFKMLLYNKGNYESTIKFTKHFPFLSFPIVLPR